MKIKFVTKNFASNAGVEDLLKKELKRVEPMFCKDTIFSAAISKSTNGPRDERFKCDITVKNGRHFLRGFGEGGSVETSIDGAVDSLKRKARKLKTVEIQKRKDYEQIVIEDYVEEEEKFEFSLERIKEIQLEPMTTEEAAIQMELSGHNFFVFKDKTDIVNVLYKREQGYGVIVVR